MAEPGRSSMLWTMEPAGILLHAGWRLDVLWLRRLRSLHREASACLLQLVFIIIAMTNPFLLSFSQSLYAYRDARRFVLLLPLQIALISATMTTGQIRLNNLHISSEKSQSMPSYMLRSLSAQLFKLQLRIGQIPL